jgi:hypothetical protein
MVNAEPCVALCNILRPDDHGVGGVGMAIREGKRVEAGWDSYHVPGSHNAIPALRRAIHLPCAPSTSTLRGLISFLQVMAEFAMMHCRCLSPT